MTFDLQRIIESKRAYRQKLAKLPIEEKMRMLEILRERLLQIKAARIVMRPANRSDV